MRKHDVRKWLHAILDLLPVILIPVFMVYSHRHDVTENVQVNYKYQSNEVNTYDDLVETNIYYLEEFNIYANQYYSDNIFFNLYSYSAFDVNSMSDSSIDEIIFDSYDSKNGNTLQFLMLPNSIRVNFTNLYNYVSLEYEDFDLVFYDCVFSIDYNLIDGKDYLENHNNDILPIYTDYNVIESVDTTNTNVMDSFMNKFNTTIDKYFNMGNVFNLNGVYQWFNINIFNGNAPTVIYSIWNIALYELIMDLLFLLYGLFMWFIDMIEKIMDKPFKSIK